jgi:hypothetical protein
MSEISCPACGHSFHAPEPVAAAAPDPSVVQWFRVDPGWIGELSTDEVYGTYLRATDGPPVSRARFVSDLAYLGVEEVLEDDTNVLVRT